MSDQRDIETDLTTLIALVQRLLPPGTTITITAAPGPDSRPQAAAPPQPPRYMGSKQ